jgi:hypothetical protein
MPLVSPPKYVVAITALLAVAAIAGAVVLKPFHGPQPDYWEALSQRVSRRAQVDLFDDFSHGLDAWQSGGNLASTWSYDKYGFVNPGTLSLFDPTLHLTITTWMPWCRLRLRVCAWHFVPLPRALIRLPSL